MPRPVPIFLADRDAAVQQSLAFWLRAEGHEVLSFLSGEAMLATALPERAIVIIDHDLGDLTAVELIERLRERDRNYPVLILASKANPDLLEAVGRYGCMVFEKPMLDDDLLKTVNELAAGSA